jgi:hypothetical protein
MPAHSARRRAGRLIALSLTATTVVGLQALHSTAHAADPINPATGCGEDSFFDGGASPAAGSTVTVALGSSQTFSVVYHDESAINMNPGFTPQYTVRDSAGHVVQSGQPATSPASAPGGTHDKFNTLVSVNWGPSAPGDYSVSIKAWDGDQNKKGGDCGVASWNVNTPAPPTTTPPTTVPKNTTTTIANTTTTTAPSTPQTNVLGETFTQSPTAAAVNGTPALTG